MPFENVAIAGLAHIDAPCTLTSQEINERLKPTFKRLRIRSDMLGDVAGIHARRLWDQDLCVADIATLAGQKALDDAQINAGQVGLLISTSVSRDYLEPSTASMVSGNLGISDNCISFDIANACLAFINGMDVAARMIERGDIDYALIVDGETSNQIYEKTLERMSSPEITATQFRNELAALTTGSGAAAMVLARAELVPEAPRYKGGVTRAANQWNQLCVASPERMVTDTRMLLIEGINLAKKTFEAARLLLGWAVSEIDQFVIHQISQPHTKAFIKSFGIDPNKVMTIFDEHGNIGPASVPIVLSKLRQLGKLKKGDRVALVGIGSGINCTMAEVVW